MATHSHIQRQAYMGNVAGILGVLTGIMHACTAVFLTTTLTAGSTTNSMAPGAHAAAAQQQPRPRLTTSSFPAACHGAAAAAVGAHTHRSAPWRCTAAAHDPTRPRGGANARRLLLQAWAKRDGSGDAIASVKRLADAVLAAVPERKGAGPPPAQAVHYLLFLLVAVWLAVSLCGPSLSALLAYSNSQQHWWTWATDGLHSGTPTGLFTKLFFVYMFGRSLEMSSGPAVLASTYLLSCAGGCMACSLLLPGRAVLVGAGGVAAVFGLFCGATLLNTQKRWHWQRAVEVAALLPFVAAQLTRPHQHLAGAVQCMGVHCGAWVPLLGGLAGAATAALVANTCRSIGRRLQQLQGRAQQQQQQQQRGGDAAAESIAGALSTMLFRKPT